MKKQHLIFNPLLIIIVSSLILFGSCDKKEKNYTETNDSTLIAKKEVIDAKTLQQIHQDVIDAFNESKQLYEAGMVIGDTTYVEELYLSNVGYVNNHGLESLLQLNNFNVQILDAFRYYINNEFSSDIYSSLAQNFYFSSLEEVRLLFVAVESFKVMSRNINNSFLDNNYYSRLDWDCLAAIAITLGITVTVGVTTVWGLIWFIVRKGWSYYGIYNLCS